MGIIASKSKSKSPLLWTIVAKKLDLYLEEYEFGREALHVFVSLYLF